MKYNTYEKLGIAKVMPMKLTLFDNTNVTTDSGLSEEMKTFYSDYLIDNAQPNLVHDQFGQKHPIPKNGGKNIEFRKYDPLAKITDPITEGVTPAGQKLEMGSVAANVKQYGGYVELSDMLIWTAIDNNLMIATELLGAQAGRTLDTITREVLVAGTVVQYAEGQVSSRDALAYTDENDNMNLTVKAIRMAVRSLRVQNAMPFEGGYYVAIIHPDCAYDLMSDPDWRKPHEYVDTEHLYKGEIGEVAGCRFVQTTEAKKFPSAGASSRDVYATLVLAKNAYGVTEVSGGGLEFIAKQLGSGGTADPLNQRATVGYTLVVAA